jgi:Phage tail assembly chaperone proteins, E, or 41 or 14
LNKPERDGFVTDEPVNEAPAAATEAAAPAAPEPYKETWPVRVKLLHGKVQNNAGHEVEELSFRAPTGGDINRYGNPVRLDNNLEPVIDEKKMTLMMAVLAGINMPNLERMDARDWSSCAMRLRIFFTPSAEGWL